MMWIDEPLVRIRPLTPDRYGELHHLEEQADRHGLWRFGGRTPAFDAFISGLAPDPAVGVHDTPNMPTCGTAPAVDACATLPVYLGTTKLGTLTFRAPNLLQPGGWTFTGVDQVMASLDPASLGFEFFIDGLDRLSHRESRRPGQGHFSLRWILLHMIEEYAQHNGHADLLREAIDGRTGD